MLIATDGEFGNAVGEIVAERSDAKVVDLAFVLERLPRSIEEASFVAVASWRDCATDFDAVDAACFEIGVPWCASRLAGGQLITGPLVIPGYGPCFKCYHRRSLSHARAPERELALQHAYANDRSLGVAGFVPPVAAMAAGAVEALSRLGPSQAGRLICADLFTSDLLDSVVIRIHDCERCGRSAHRTRGDRFVERLVPGLQELLE